VGCRAAGQMCGWCHFWMVCFGLYVRIWSILESTSNRKKRAWFHQVDGVTVGDVYVLEASCALECQVGHGKPEEGRKNLEHPKNLENLLRLLHTAWALRL
jgi:hypothetical protein